MAVSTSRIVLEQDAVRILAQQDSLNQLLPVPLAATATAADTTSIRSTTLDRGNPATGAYDGLLVKIADDVGAGPAVGETSRVVSAGYDGTDKITVSPAFTAAVINAQQFILYPARVTPEIVVSAIREVLRNMDAPAPDLATDTATTVVDRLFIVWSSVMLIKLGSDDWQQWGRLAHDRARRLNYRTLLPLDSISVLSREKKEE